MKILETTVDPCPVTSSADHVRLTDVDILLLSNCFLLAKDKDCVLSKGNKENRSEIQVDMNTRNCANNPICMLYWVFLSTFLQEKQFLASNLSAIGRNNVCSLFSREAQKRLARDIFDTLVKHFGLVRDVTGSDSLPQNGSCHRRVRRFFNRQDWKSSEELLSVFLFF